MTAQWVKGHAAGKICFAIHALFCVLLLVFAISLGQAQQNSGSINGTVTDTTGAAVSGATVTVANTSTNATYTGRRAAKVTIPFPSWRWASIGLLSNRAGSKNLWPTWKFLVDGVNNNDVGSNHTILIYSSSDQSGPALEEKRVSRGLAVADLFNNGNMDVVISDIDGGPMILRNRDLRGRHCELRTG